MPKKAGGKMKTAQAPGVESLEDDMMIHESGNAHASLTVPVAAGQLKLGAHIIMNGDKPCKIIERKDSKTGKHGHLKCRFTAIDIFTGDKLQDLHQSTHNASCPVVVRTEYDVMGVDDDDYMTLMDDAYERRFDLKLPTFPEGTGAELRTAIEQAAADDKTVRVAVTAAMGRELVTSFKTIVQ
jgi:translation initiation factor 5A